ncbi:ribosome silencing factor [Bauldia litoralis]|uniref:ribosome silencing factor n=1 Tax=Bauldia litoralis TaxID=665467 RepID=UPI003D64EA28
MPWRRNCRKSPPRHGFSCPAPISRFRQPYSGNADARLETVTYKGLSFTCRRCADDNLGRDQTLTTALRSESAVHRSPPIAPASSDLTAADALRVVLASLEDSKAEDLTSIDITGKTTIGDFIVVASGRSHRHVGSLADRLVQDLKSAGFRDLKIEGQKSCDWVLVDTGDIIVHIFRPEVRDFYNIEKMWRGVEAA